MNRDIPMAMFSTGSTPFSTRNAADNTTKTNVSYLTNGDTTYMFLRNFSLSSDQASSAWAFNVNVRRARGVVVYMNGNEAYRQNMPNGTVDGDTFSFDSWGTALTQYYASPPLRSLASTLRVRQAVAVSVSSPGVDWPMQHTCHLLNGDSIIVDACESSSHSVVSRGLDVATFLGS